LSVVGCQSGTRFSRSLFSFSSVGDYGGLLGWKRDESRRQARKFRSGKWGQVILRRPTFDLSLSSGAGNFSLAWTKGLPGLRRGSDGQRERAAGSIRTGFLLHAEAQRLQLTTWPLNEGKGIDDYLATKAGTDPPGKRKLSPSCEQRQAVLQHFAACSPVSSLKLSWVI
jgi:hypothetical protein